MAVLYEAPHRGFPLPNTSMGLGLEDRFEVIKEIGDGSFGSVSLARVRSGGATIARRGTMIAVKTMKKTFDSFNNCLDLREVIFLRSLPNHPHLVPALDIFLDPLTKKLHIAMEYMDGNLYQLMKARDHKYMDGSCVKSILFQIISGLEHIHAHHFFHRDIKPENILVSTSAPQDTASTFKRYSALVTPPSTPPAYTVKIADFGLARETHSKVPYTTYVSTRWYRAPEVLLRAGEYSAPVDIWAIGAMAVEIATLKPLFPGQNEVDQVWRVCEIMGSPGNWYNKHGQKVGGGEWRDGIKLASKLGFAFPKMAPHSLDTILRQPTWPASLSHFVTWCLMWDPKNRPTSTQALQHEYFRDAVDPLRPKSSSRLLGRKQSVNSTQDSVKEQNDSLPSVTTKTSSWFRRSLITREISAPAVTQHPALQVQKPTNNPTPLHTQPDVSNMLKPRPIANKRATWTHGVSNNAAPMPILPSIRPVSPMVSDSVNAQATAQRGQDAAKNAGSQLSVASNQYTEMQRQEAEKALTGRQSGLISPTSSHRESFFSHLRKRARRFSGRYQTPISPNDDIESNAANSQFSNSSVPNFLGSLPAIPNDSGSFADLDKALQNVRSSIDFSKASAPARVPVVASHNARSTGAGNTMLKRHHSTGSREASNPSIRQIKATHKPSHPNLNYETPDEEDELLHDSLMSARNAVDMATQPTPTWNKPSTLQPPISPHPYNATYPTPSPSANRNSIQYGHTDYVSQSKPVEIAKPRQTQDTLQPKWPTPPYEESQWASNVTSSLFSGSSTFR